MKEFNFNKKLISRYFWLGIIAAAIGLIAFFTGATISSITFVVPFMLYFIMKNFVVLKVFDDRYEIKQAPLKAVTIINKTDILEVDRENKKICIRLKDGNKTTLALNSFSPEDREEVIEILCAGIN